MADTRHGRCTTCNVIWCWEHRAGLPLVSKGEAYCGVCGGLLTRTAASLAKKIPISQRPPIRAAVAQQIRARRYG